MTRILRFAPILILCAACKKEEPPAPATVIVPPAPASEAQEKVAAPAEPAIEVDSLPVEEDFEADAEKEVTAANLTKKLDELEKEIESE